MAGFFFFFLVGGGRSNRDSHLIIISFTLISLNLEELPSFCLLWHWHFWRVQVMGFFRMPCVCFLLISFRVNVFCQEYYTGVVSLVPHNGRHVISLCSIIGNSEFDHLGSLPGFSTVKLPFPLCNWQIIQGEPLWECMDILFSKSFT